jgi:hypothetical protein
MKVGGTRPTAPKTFLFAIKRLCTQQANILAYGYCRPQTHNTRLKQHWQSTSGAQHKHVHTPQELTVTTTIDILYFKSKVESSKLTQPMNKINVERKNEK